MPDIQLGGGQPRDGLEMANPGWDKYCELRSNDLRDQYSATGGTPDLEERWTNLKRQCSFHGWDIDGLKGNQPPTQMAPVANPAPQGTPDPANDEIESSWLGFALSVLVIFALGPELIIASVAKAIARQILPPGPQQPQPPPPDPQQQQPVTPSGTQPTSPLLPHQSNPVEGSPNVSDEADYAVGEYKGVDPTTLPKSQGGTKEDEE